MINTILVEDDLYIQKHFVDRLAADGEFHLVGVFRDAFEAEKHCDATVKLVLMDVQTQRKHSGLAAAERIKKVFPQIKIVVATSLVDPEVLQRAKMGAADSLWYKDHGTEELMSVVKRTLAGEKVFPDIAPAIEMEGTMSDAFSPRQLDILRLYIKGFTYQEIADKGYRLNVTAVGDNAFAGCKALKKLTIGNKVTVIGKNAFKKCSKLETVVIGKAVKTISSKAFLEDNKIKKITFKGKKLKTVNKNAFSKKAKKNIKSKKTKLNGNKKAIKLFKKKLKIK